MTSISLLPESLDLQLYGGDGVELEMTVTDNLGVPVPLTGTMAAQIRTSRVNQTIMAEFEVDIIDPSNGLVSLMLTGSQTSDLHGNPNAPTERFTGVWDVQWTPDTGRTPITVVQGKVESSLDVTRLASP
jgi:hypothetical protein